MSNRWEEKKSTFSRMIVIVARCVAGIYSIKFRAKTMSKQGSVIRLKFAAAAAGGN